MPTRTALSSNIAQSGTTTIVASSCAFVAGDLAVALISVQKDLGNGTDPLTGSNLTIANSGTAYTWTRRIGLSTTSNPDFGDTVVIYTAPVTATQTVNVTATFAGFTPGYKTIAVYQYDGQAASPIGVTGSKHLANNGADAITLSGTPTALGEVIGIMIHTMTVGGSPLSSSPGTNHSELSDVKVDGFCATQIQVQNVGTQSSSFSWADTDTNNEGGDFTEGVAIEILHDVGYTGTGTRKLEDGSQRSLEDGSARVLESGTGSVTQTAVPGTITIAQPAGTASATGTVTQTATPGQVTVTAPAGAPGFAPFVQTAVPGVLTLTAPAGTASPTGATTKVATPGTITTSAPAGSPSGTGSVTQTATPGVVTLTAPAGTAGLVTVPEFCDDFTYADGDLAGNSPWRSASIDFGTGAPEIQVVSNQIGTSGSDPGSFNQGYLLVSDLVTLDLSGLEWSVNFDCIGPNVSGEGGFSFRLVDSGGLGYGVFVGNAAHVQLFAPSNPAVAQNLTNWGMPEEGTGGNSLWHNIHMTKDATGHMEVYIDGVGNAGVGISYVTDTTVTSTPTLLIIFSRNVNAPTLQTRVDNLCVYDTVVAPPTPALTQTATPGVVTLTAPAGTASASGAAVQTAIPAVITTSAPTGTASGSGTASQVASPGTVTITAPAGSAVTAIVQTAVPGTVTLTAPAGTGSPAGAAAQTAIPGQVTITAPAGSPSAVGAASQTAAPGVITLTNPAGTAGAGTLVQPATPGQVTLSAPAGSPAATGTAGVTATPGVVTLTAPPGSPAGTGSVTRTATPGTITMTAPAGSTLAGLVQPATPGVITLSAPSGTPAMVGPLVHVAVPAVILVTAPAGIASGAGTIVKAAIPGTITITAPSGTATGLVEDPTPITLLWTEGAVLEWSEQPTLVGRDRYVIEFEEAVR